MNLHTKSPWEAEPDGFNIEIVGNRSTDEEGTSVTSVAKVYGNATSLNVTKANAALIVSAPYLLDACKAAISYFDRRDDGPAMTSVQMFATLQDAIDRAEGR